MTGPTAPPPPFRRDRHVHGWLVAKGVSDAGDAAWVVAIAWTAVQVAGPAAAGLVVAAGTLPRALVLLIGGVVADRLPVRRILLAVTVVRLAVLVTTIAVATGQGESAALLVTAAIAFGVCDAVFEPAAATLGRQLVRADDLAAYAALAQTLLRLGTMAGAAFGGALVAAAGLVGSAAANAVTYTVVLVALALLTVRFPLPRARSEPVLRGVADGFGYLRRDARARRLVIVLSGLNLFIGPTLGLGLALRAQQADWGAGWLGGLQTAVGLGALLGAVAILRSRPCHEMTVGFGLLVVQGLAIMCLAVPLRATAVVACVAIGLTAGAASAVVSAVFQRTVAADHLGRTASIQRLGDDVLMPVAMVGFGALAGGASLGWAFLAFGGGMTVAMLTVLVRSGVDELAGTAAAAAAPVGMVATDDVSAGTVVRP